MKNFLEKFSRKNLVTIAVVLLLAFISFGAYTIISINKNVQDMTVAAEEPAYFPDYPPTNIAGKSNEQIDQIKRGEYLTKAGDCIACHTNTPEKGKAFAGGLAMKTPFGTIYSPNLTSDKETGIGKWTDEEFIKAMREGISPQGHYYYPAFPYFYFSKMSTDDIKAIKAYLDSIPAVSQANKDTEMVMPFNIRFLQLGWRILFFHGKEKEVFQPNPQKSADWNRGGYLVEGLGHCAMCHSPSYDIFTDKLPLAAPIRKYDLTGAKVQGYLAPNISKSNLATISDEEIIRVFTEDRMIGGGKVQGPMVEVNHNSLRNLSNNDLKAIAVYLKSVDSQLPPKPKAGAGGMGKSIYEGYCAGCHAAGAGGAPRFGDAAGWGPVMKGGIDAVYDNAIKGKGGMPAKGTCISCTDNEIKQAVDYMVAAASNEGGKAAQTAVATKPKPFTLEDGKRLYAANCSACHNTGFKGAPIPGDKAAWQATINKGFYATYLDVMSGKQGHIIHGACPECSDAEIKAALKYMMQQSTSTKDFNLW